MVAAENPRAVIGANNPPSPFDEVSAAVEDLREEAGHWLDGGAVSSQDEADAIAKLLDAIRRAEKRADAARIEEKRPHDEAAKAVQAKYKPLLDRCGMIAAACKKALTPWLEMVEAEKRAAAEAARRGAEAKAEEARAALRAAADADLAAREEAEALVREAKAAATAATRAEGDTAKAAGGARAVSLRTVLRSEVTDMRAFAAWAWTHRRGDVDEMFTDLAARLVREGVRAIPGIDIIEERRAV